MSEAQVSSYRRKPVVIQAIRYLPGQTCEQVAEFMGIEHNCDDCSEQSPWGIGETPEGFMEAAPGDWIIKDVQGDFYPCKPDIFEATYEPADEEERPASIVLRPSPMTIELTLTHYELVNLREALVFLADLGGDTGDWYAQVLHKVEAAIRSDAQGTTGHPNKTAATLRADLSQRVGWDLLFGERRG